MQTHPALCAIFLAAYNGKEYLDEQISSILSQKNVDVQIFISVDRSTDGTEAYLINYADVEPRISLLPIGLQFGSAASNFFNLISKVNISNFDYIAFSDQDDIWLESKLDRAILSITNNNVDAYSSSFIAFWNKNNQRLVEKSQKQQKWDYMFESAGPGCTFVLTKDLASDIQSFISTIDNKEKNIAFHDWFIYAFARSRQYKWYIDDEAHILYRQHRSNVIGANVGFKAKLVRWNKMREGWFASEVIKMSEILGYSDSWPIKKLQRYAFSDRCLLILNATKLRRRLRDSIALALFFVIK
jgi:rhamnosyltransferase